MGEFIYTMKKVRKAHGDKVILDDVTMAFLPGAKIGVLGVRWFLWRGAVPLIVAVHPLCALSIDEVNTIGARLIDEVAHLR